MYLCEYVSVSVCYYYLIGQKGIILMGSLTLRANEPARISPSWPISSLRDILTGSLTLTASEPSEMSLSFFGEGALDKIYVASLNWWKTTFGGRRPSVEDDLQWKITFGGRQPSAEDDFWWKATFVGR